MSDSGEEIELRNLLDQLRGNDLSKAARNNSLQKLTDLVCDAERPVFASALTQSSALSRRRAPTWCDVVECMLEQCIAETQKAFGSKDSTLRLSGVNKAWANLNSVVGAAERCGFFLLPIVSTLVNELVGLVTVPSSRRDIGLATSAVTTLRTLLSCPAYAHCLPVDIIRPLLLTLQDECLETMKHGFGLCTTPGRLFQQCKAAVVSTWTAMLVAKPELIEPALDFVQSMLSLPHQVDGRQFGSKLYGVVDVLRGLHQALRENIMTVLDRFLQFWKVWLNTLIVIWPDAHSKLKSAFLQVVQLMLRVVNNVSLDLAPELFGKSHGQRCVTIHQLLCDDFKSMANDLVSQESWTISAEVLLRVSVFSELSRQLESNASSLFESINVNYLPRQFLQKLICPASASPPTLNALQLLWMFGRRCPDLLSAHDVCAFIQRISTRLFSKTGRQSLTGNKSAVSAETTASEQQWTCAALSSLAWASNVKVKLFSSYRQQKQPDHSDVKSDLMSLQRLLDAWSELTMSLMSHVQHLNHRSLMPLLLAVVADIIENELIDVDTIRRVQMLLFESKLLQSSCVSDAQLLRLLRLVLLANPASQEWTLAQCPAAMSEPWTRSCAVGQENAPMSQLFIRFLLSDTASGAKHPFRALLDDLSGSVYSEFGRELGQMDNVDLTKAFNPADQLRMNGVSELFRSANESSMLTQHSDLYATLICDLLYSIPLSSSSPSSDDVSLSYLRVDQPSEPVVSFRPEFPVSANAQFANVGAGRIERNSYQPSHCCYSITSSLQSHNQRALIHAVPSAQITTCLVDSLRSFVEAIAGDRALRIGVDEASESSVKAEPVEDENGRPVSVRRYPQQRARLYIHAVHIALKVLSCAPEGANMLTLSLVSIVAECVLNLKKELDTLLQTWKLEVSNETEASLCVIAAVMPTLIASLLQTLRLYGSVPFQKLVEAVETSDAQADPEFFRFHEAFTGIADFCSNLWHFAWKSSTFGRESQKQPHFEFLALLNLSADLLCWLEIESSFSIRVKRRLKELVIPSVAELVTIVRSGINAPPNWWSPHDDTDSDEEQQQKPSKKLKTEVVSPVNRSVEDATLLLDRLLAIECGTRMLLVCILDDFFCPDDELDPMRPDAESGDPQLLLRAALTRVAQLLCRVSADRSSRDSGLFARVSWLLQHVSVTLEKMKVEEISDPDQWWQSNGMNFRAFMDGSFPLVSCAARLAYLSALRPLSSVGLKAFFESIAVRFSDSDYLVRLMASELIPQFTSVDSFASCIESNTVRMSRLPRGLGSLLTIKPSPSSKPKTVSTMLTHSAALIQIAALCHSSVVTYPLCRISIFAMFNAFSDRWRSLSLRALQILAMRTGFVTSAFKFSDQTVSWKFMRSIHSADLNFSSFDSVCIQPSPEMVSTIQPAAIDFIAEYNLDTFIDWLEADPQATLSTLPFLSLLSAADSVLVSSSIIAEFVARRELSASTRTQNSTHNSTVHELPRLFAFAMLARQQYPQGSEALLACLKADNPNLDSLISSQMTFIMQELLNLCLQQSKIQITVDCLTKVFRDITGNPEKLLDLLCRKTNGRLLTIVQVLGDLQSKFATIRRPDYLCAVFNYFCSLVSLVSPRIGEPPILTVVLSILDDIAIDFPLVFKHLNGNECFHLIRNIMKLLWNQDAKLSGLLNRFVDLLVVTLSAPPSSYSSLEMHSQTRVAASHCLIELMEHPSDSVQAAVRELDPFPLEFVDLNSRLSAKKADSGILSVLRQFATAHSMTVLDSSVPKLRLSPPRSTVVALQLLYKTLKSRTREVAELISSIVVADHTEAISVMNRVFQSLCQFSHALHSREIRSAAAQCLGALGPVSYAVVDSMQVQRTIQRQIKISTSPFTVNPRQSAAVLASQTLALNDLDSTYECDLVLIAHLLLSYGTHSKQAVREACAVGLRALFAMEQASADVQAVSLSRRLFHGLCDFFPDDESLVQPWVRSGRNQAPNLGAGSDIDEAWLLCSNLTCALLQPRLKSELSFPQLAHSAISKLCHALIARYLSQSSSSQLFAFVYCSAAPAMLAEPNIAVIAFPHLIIRLLQSFSKVPNAAELSRQLAQRFNALMSQADLEPALASIIIESLNVVHARYLHNRYHVLFHKNVMSNQAARDPFRPNLRQPVTENVTYFDQFFNELDSKLLTQLSSRHGDAESALFHFEFSLDKAFGGFANLPAQLTSRAAQSEFAERQKLALQIFQAIEDPDAISAIEDLFPPSSDLSHQDAGFDAVELALHEHNNDWLSVLQTYDVYSDSSESKNGISLALKNLGCGQTLSTLQTQSNLFRGATRPFLAESAGFPVCVKEALQAVQHGRSNTVQISLQTSLNSFLDQTLDLDCGRTGKMFRALADLQIICDVDKTQDCDVAADQWFDSLWIDTTSSSVEMLLRDHFSLIEPVLSLHSALARAAPHGASKSFDAVLFRAKCARQADRFQIANSLLLSARKFLASASVSNATRLKWQLEQANYLKSTGSSNRAISHVQSVIQNLLAAPVSPFEVSRVNLLSMQAYEALADWSAQSQAASSDAIAQSYESALLATETDVVLQAKHRPRILLGFGVYQLRLLQSLEEKQNSPEWKTFVMLLEQKRMDLEQLRATKPKNAAAMSDVRAMILVTEKEYAMDQQQVEQLEAAISGALVRAVELLGECLMRSQHYDHEAVYRLVSAWFAHSSNREVNRRMGEICNAVAHKFLPLRYQIASHLSKFQPKPVLSDSDYFLQCVASLTERMALQHPHHIIYTLISLRNVNVLRADAKVVQGYVPKLDKQDAAKALIQIVQNASEAHRKIVAAVDSFTATMLQISNTEFPAGTRSFRNSDLNALRDIKTLPIPTLTLPSAIPNQSLHAQADSMIRIDTFNSVIRISESGLTHPMILTVRGSDQREYEMLLKPKDDLRQDAVMEQLFGLCNVLLRRNDKTRVRNLQIRTYNVIPLTPAVGLLQFVSNTKSMSDLLKFAHDTFRPQDWTYDMANNCFGDKVGTTPTRQRYDQVCENYKPAMHSWFTYQYGEPAEWFKRRQAYTRSVAVNSIVGYFAGIGDRHSGNILFDELTGEVVHIDLGVAFDQGRFLKTPENIPFRLTRELVDGMGICGVEGTFRRCCEESASVLRANADMLTTIVQVFTQDPLYKWSLSPAKIQQLQRSVSRSPAIPELENANAAIEGNSQAHRALIRFQQKLAGQEAAGILSVPGQVSKLINEARDPSNLHTLFHGWKPWM